MAQHYKEQMKYNYKKLLCVFYSDSYSAASREHPNWSNSFAYQYVKHQSQWDSHITETRGSSKSAKLFRFDCSLKCALYSAKGTPFS